MERKHAQRLRAEHQNTIRYKELHVLDIPDDYQFMDPELISLLRDGVDPIIEKQIA